MRILVIKPSSFGDIVHGLLVADRIRSQLGVARIDWVARDVFAPLVAASGIVRTVIPFHRSPGGFLRVLREIRRESYDVVLDMQGLARSGLMTFAARAKVKIGRFDAREGSKFFYKIKVPLPTTPSPHHAVTILRQFQRPLGLYDLDPEVLEFPDTAPLKKSLPEGAVLLFPESRRTDKEWPGFAALAREIRRAWPDHAIGWCGTGSGALPDGISDGSVTDLRGAVSIGDLPALFRKASVVVANDSGPIHLAAAMGVRVIAVFGPTDPRQYGPYPLDRPGNAVVEAEGGDLSRLPVSVVRDAISRMLDSP